MIVQKHLFKIYLSKRTRGSFSFQTFQRGWVWDDDRIRSLLASISVSFPIGAVMQLQTGGQNIRFKPRPLAGTHKRLLEVSPEILILDGQQRVTSLYQALIAQVAVETKDAKGKPISRWYYLDMKKTMHEEDDREEAVLSIPEDKLVRTFGGEIVLELGTAEREFANDLFPMNQIFTSAEWRREYNK